jgi:hypothetical protein
MDEARRKDLEGKLRELCEYCERTGDWELVQEILALLEEATRALREGQEAAFVAKWEKRNAKRSAKLTAKKATHARKAGV